MEDFKKQLKQGDIIMHHAHGWMSNLIRKCDLSDYNHCSIYDKDGYIFEVVNGGLKRKLLEESISTQKTVLVTNFRVLKIPQEKAHLLIENIKKNYNYGSFAHSQLLLLTIISLKRNLFIKGFIGGLINSFLRKICRLFLLVFDRRDENLLCSELIYRTYMDVYKNENDVNFKLEVPLECSPIFELESSRQKIDLHCDIDEINKRKLERIKDSLENKNSKNKFYSFSKKYLPTFFSQNSSTSLETNSLKVFSEINNSDKKASALDKIFKRTKFYNFISPGDIVRSINIQPIKTYRTRFTAKYPNCNICNPTTTN